MQFSLFDASNLSYKAFYRLFMMMINYDAMDSIVSFDAQCNVVTSM